MENELSEKRIKLLSEDIIKNNLLIDWDLLTINEKWSIDFLTEYRNETVEKRCKMLSKDIIKKYLIINWEIITMTKTLPIDFLREYQDEIAWYYVSKYQKLDEDTII